MIFLHMWILTLDIIAQEFQNRRKTVIKDLFDEVYWTIRSVFRKINDKRWDLKYRIQRFKRGYADVDLFSIDCWFLEIMPRMLDEFNDVSFGYPGTITPEEWKKIINEISFKFKESTDDCSYKNKYEDMEWEWSDKLIAEGHDCSMKDLWFKEEMKIDAYKKQCFEEGIDLFKKWFFQLWY